MLTGTISSIPFLLFALLSPVTIYFMVTEAKQTFLILSTMTRDELMALLGCSDVIFRHAAIDNIVMTFPSHADLFFNAFHNNDESAKEMANAAYQWMPILRDGFDGLVAPFELSREYSTFGNLAHSHSVFIHEMHNHLQYLDEATAQHTIDVMWSYFPGLRADLNGVTDHNKPEEHRQLMVFVTGRCNMHCPYCFSKELQGSSISKTDMIRVLTWAQCQNVQSLLPCGGEPLIYENMDWLIREVGQRGMRMYFATNLSVPLPNAMKDGRHNTIGQLHVHLTDELFKDKCLMSTFRTNMRLCRENNLDIILRGNIYSNVDGNQYNEWLKIAKEFDIHALNVAFAIPSHTGINRFVSFEAIRGMIPHLHRILELCRENNICISIAKPLPLCLFPEDMALDILRHNHNATFCNINQDGGMHNLSLSTDLRFSPCLGVDEPSVPFADNLCWETLQGIIGHAVHMLQLQPLFERCSGCFLYHRRMCQGACLSYKQISRNRGVTCGS